MPEEGPAAQIELLDVAQTLDADAFVRRALQPSAPRLLLNFVATADGAAVIDGRSGPISGPGDRAIFHALRASVDAVMVGAGTARAEQYGPMIPREEVRRERTGRGLAAQPVAVLVSRSGALPANLPLLGDADGRIVLMTNADAKLPPAAAHVDYIRTGGDEVDLVAGLAQLRERFGIGSVLCEGGPTLAGSLAAAGVVDELWLTVGPLAAGHSEAPRILGGPPFDRPLELELASVARCGAELFLRYRVASGERVSRITID